MAIDSRERRDGRPLEVRRPPCTAAPCPSAATCAQPQSCASAALTCAATARQRLGCYDPLRKETNLNAPAIKKWLEVGAQPSETVGNLLRRAMIIETAAPLRYQQPQKAEGEERGRKSKK